MESNLTLESMKALIASLTKVSPYRWWVVKTEYLQRLRDEVPPSTTPLNDILNVTATFTGITLYPKAQRLDAWMFSDEVVLLKYLNGELSELDLIALIGTSVRALELEA